VPPAVARLAEIPGVSENLARAIIAEIGLDMSRFPTPGHLVSWAGLAPVAAQSGKRQGRGKKGHGDSYARNAATQAANGAAKTRTFLGERYQRLARRRGKARRRRGVGAAGGGGGVGRRSGPALSRAAAAPGPGAQPGSGTAGQLTRPMAVPPGPPGPARRPRRSPPGWPRWDGAR